MPRLLLLMLCFVAAVATGQDVRYVNAPNLVIRDNHLPDYNVCGIAHAGCEVTVDTVLSIEYIDKNILKTMCHISIPIYMPEHQYKVVNLNGWVPKRYLVKSRALVTVKGADTTLSVNATRVPVKRFDYYLQRHGTSSYKTVDKGIAYSNARKYVAPKYQGGNPLPLPPPPKPREYLSGPRGGCYYINAAGKKVYVAPENCK